MRSMHAFRCLAAGIGLVALTGHSQTVETNAAPAEPAAVAPVNPLVADLDALVAALKAKDIEIDPAAARRAVYECVARTSDPEARLMTEAEIGHLREEQEGHDYHPGIRISMTNGTPCVADVAAPSPAAEAGLQVGDQLLSIGGRATTNTTIVAALAALRSDSNNAVRIVARHSAGETVTTEVVRALAPVAAIEIAEKLPQQIAYLKLNGLYKDSGRELVSILRGWAETDRFGFVLDLRGAGGDDVDSVVPVGSLFATGGSLLFAFRDLDDQDLAVYKATEGDPLTTPVMVLVDRNTSGAAEVLAAVLANSVRGALVIGAPTRGDALVREGLPLPTGELLYLATRRLGTASATYGGAIPVQPDIQIADSAPGSEFEPEAGPDRRETLDVELGDRALRDRIRDDVALKRAIDVLLGLKALNIRASGVASP